MPTARTIRLATHISLVSLLALGAVACAADRRDPADGRTSSVVDSTVTSAARVEPTTTSAAPTSTTTVAAPVRPTEAVDTLLPIGEGGARLHLHCAGSGPSTVVLISGFGGGSDTWGAVAPGLSAEARVCSYDRFGTGTSDAPSTDQTFASEADDLRRLLQTAGEVGPYVVVGHSFGGAEAVAFTSRFSDEVDGLPVQPLGQQVSGPGAVAPRPGPLAGAGHVRPTLLEDELVRRRRRGCGRRGLCVGKEGGQCCHLGHGARDPIDRDGNEVISTTPMCDRALNGDLVFGDSAYAEQLRCRRSNPPLHRTGVAIKGDHDCSAPARIPAA